MYTDLLCRTYKAVKAVRPNAIIVGGAVAWIDITFITGMLNAGAGKCMDMMSVHPYIYSSFGIGNPFAVPHNSPASVGADKFMKSITATENLIRQKTGRTIPIAVTEEGRATRTGSNDQITADYLTAIYNRAPSVPFLKGIWWFCLEDFPSGAFGLLRSNNTKKPSFAAYQAAANK